MALGSDCKGEDSESERETKKERRADGHVPFGKKRGERVVVKRSFVQPSLVASSSANPPEPIPRVSVSQQIRPQCEKGTDNRWSTLSGRLLPFSRHLNRSRSVLGDRKVARVVQTAPLRNGDERRLVVGRTVDRRHAVHARCKTACDVRRKDPVDSSEVETLQSRGQSSKSSVLAFGKREDAGKTDFEEGEFGRVGRLGRRKTVDGLNDDVRVSDEHAGRVRVRWRRVVVGGRVDERA